MAEYICREAILDDLEKEIEAGNVALDEDVWVNKGLKIAIRDIKDIKTADVQPVKRGRWEYYKNNGIFDTHKCTLCGEKYEMYMDIEPTTIYKYCPNCGARMIKDGDTE